MDGLIRAVSFIFSTATGRIVGYVSPLTGEQAPLPVSSAENAAASIASASPTNPSAANIVTWNLKIAGAQGAGFNIQLPTAAAILAALSAAVPLDGTFSVRLRITNVDTTQTGTVLTGAGITLSGTMTIATATVREFDLVITSPTTITITNAGTSAL